MEQDPIKFTDKKVDESWKDRIQGEKESNSNFSVDPEPAKNPKEESVSFVAFLNSIAVQTLVCLGEIGEPNDKNTKDLDQAKQMIDLLVLFKEKTKGNLTAEETKFFESVLADLQLRYVEALKS